MFTISTDPDESSSYHSYSPTLDSEFGADSRSASSSPSGLIESTTTEPSSTNTSHASTKNTRKRRAQLQPINLVSSSRNSNYELANDIPTTSGSQSNSDEESSNHLPRSIAQSNDLHDKRIRLTSSSSTSSTASLLSLIGEGNQLASADSYHDLADSEFGQNTPVRFVDLKVY